MVFQQRKAAFFLLLVAIGMILLAAGLPDMQLQPGLPIPGAAATLSTNKIVETTSTESVGIPFGWLLEGMLSVGFAILLVLLLIGLIRKSDIRLLIKMAAGLAAVLVLVFLLPPIGAVPAMTASEEPVAGTPQPFDYSTMPIGDPPASLYRLVIIFLVLAVAVTSIWLLREYFRKPKEENRLELESNAALRAIEEGQDLKNVIIRCYLNMAKVLKEEQGIEREEAVTPREFETWLAHRGVPNVPISQLTRLFEKARYGGKLPDPKDEQDAIECLSAISIYCRQKAKAIG